MLPCGAVTSNGVDVEVSNIDGKLQYYGSRRVTMPSSLSPQLTADQAKAAAASALGIVDVETASNATLSATPDRMTWMLEVGGVDASGEHQFGAVDIDAVTGSVVATRLCGSSTDDIKVPGPAVRVPQKVVQTSRLMWIRTLCINIGGASFSFDKRKSDIRITLKGKVCSLKLSSPWVKWNGQRYKLSGSPKVVNGRVMVSDDVESIIQGKGKLGVASLRPTKSK